MDLDLIIKDYSFKQLESMLFEHNDIEYVFLIFTPIKKKLSAELGYIFKGEGISIDDLQNELKYEFYILLYDLNDFNAKNHTFLASLQNIFDNLSDYSLMREELFKVFNKYSAYDEIIKNRDTIENELSYIFESYRLSKNIIDDLSKILNKSLDVSFLKKGEKSRIKKYAKQSVSNSYKMPNEGDMDLDLIIKIKIYDSIKSNIEEAIANLNINNIDLNSFLLSLFLDENEYIVYDHKKAYNNDISSIQYKLYEYLISTKDFNNNVIAPQSQKNARIFISMLTRRFKYVNLYSLEKYYGKSSNKDSILQAYFELTKNRIKDINNNFMTEITYFEYRSIIEESRQIEMTGYYQAQEDLEVDKQNQLNDYAYNEYAQRKNMYKSKSKFLNQHDEYLQDIDPQSTQYGFVPNKERVEFVINEILRGNYDKITIEEEAEEEIMVI